MSHGTSVILMKKVDVEVPKIAVTKATEDFDSAVSDSLVTLGIKGDGPKHKRFIGVDVPGVECYDLKTDTPCVKAVQLSFNSMFDPLREAFVDEYKLNSYDPWRCSAVISPSDARELLIAVNYVLLGHYDSKVEGVMDNRFIEPVGSLSPEWSRFKYKEKFPNDNDDSTGDYDDATSMLEDMRSLLHVYLNCEFAHDDYTLVVEIWG